MGAIYGPAGWLAWPAGLARWPGLIPTPSGRANSAARFVCCRGDGFLEPYMAGLEGLDGPDGAGSEADAGPEPALLRAKRPLPRPRARPRPRAILTSDTDDDNDIDDDLVDDREDGDSAPEAGTLAAPGVPAVSRRRGGRRTARSRSRSRSRSLTSLTDGEAGDRLTSHFRLLDINGSQGSLSQVGHPRWASASAFRREV